MSLKILQHLPILICSVFLTFGPSSRADVVRFETSLGDFDLQLFDDVAPKTVENFMQYVTSGEYSDTIVHRSIPGFVIQGGGFRSDFTAVDTHEPVENEFSRSNQRGTISMAKLAGNPDSATSQWFINLNDNSANLDNQNGGFTVFGEIIGDGMSIVDEIAQLDRFAFSSPFSELPLRDYTQADFPDQPNDDSLVMIKSVRAVPEPSGMLLAIGLGFGLLGFRRSRAA